MKTLNLILAAIKWVFALTLTCSALVGFAYLRGDLSTEKVVEILKSKDKLSLKEAIETIPPQYGLSPILVAAVVNQESGGQKVARYEPGQVDRARKACGRACGDAMVKMYASSHGEMQVMGYHSKTYGIQPGDLYDTETNIEVGSAILANCMTRHKDKTKYDQIFNALTCYNGSPIYSQTILSRLGKVLIEKNL